MFPLQLSLVALVWRKPLGAARTGVLIGAYLLLAAFFWWRAQLFGHAFWVYATPGAEPAAVDWLARLTASVASMGPWWQALTAGATVLAGAYLLGLVAATIALAVAAERRQWLIATGVAGSVGALA